MPKQWYLLYGIHIGPLRRRSDDALFSDCGLDTHFETLVCNFIDFGAKMEPKWGVARNWDHFRSNSQKVAKGVQSPTPGLKKVPPGAKMEAKWSPGHPKINGLGVKM